MHSAPSRNVPLMEARPTQRGGVRESLGKSNVWPLESRHINTITGTNGLALLLTRYMRGRGGERGQSASKRWGRPCDSPRRWSKEPAVKEWMPPENLRVWWPAGGSQGKIRKELQVKNYKEHYIKRDSALLPEVPSHSLGGTQKRHRMPGRRKARANEGR